MKRLLLIVFGLGLSACAGDATGPKDASVAGTWRFSYSNMTGALQGITVSCSGGPFDFSVTQSGSTFSGVQVGLANLVCTSQGQTLFSQSVAGETIVNGQVTGSSVTFRLGSIAGQHTATVSGTSMSGSAQWIFADASTSLILSGQFTAARM